MTLAAMQHGKRMNSLVIYNMMFPRWSEDPRRPRGRRIWSLLGHKGLRIVMRYAHLSPGYLSEEVKKLDTFFWLSNALALRCASPSRPSTCATARRGPRASPHA
jgi:hypothetical protein